MSDNGWIVPFLGVEIEVDPMHLVHVILVFTAGITVGHFIMRYLEPK